MKLLSTEYAKAAYLFRFRYDYNLAETNFRLKELSANNPLASFFDEDLAWVEKEFNKHDAMGISIISILDPGYPFLLKQIPDAPSLLFIRGKPEIFTDLKSLSVVGTREATENGRKIASRIAWHFANNGWCITSGLALGIDASAHEGALEAGGTTVAVLAHGLESALPKRNEELAHRILDSGGAWISEHPIGTTPKPHLFVRRNRLQIGISAGSIIVEAGLKSGSSTQARFCQEQNKPVFAVVPDSPENRLGLFSVGTQDFVDSSAALPLRSRNDYGSVEEHLAKSLARLQSPER